MRPYFKVGSTVAKSSPVEGTFSNLKNVVFKGRLPMRVDKFVTQHLNYLDGKLKLAYAEHNKNIISDPKLTKPRSDFTIKSVSIEEKTRSSTYMSNKTSLDITTENEIQVKVNNINKKQISLNKIEREKNVSWTNNEVEMTKTSKSCTVSPSLLVKSSKLSNNTFPSEFESIARYAKTSTPLKEEQKEKNTTFVVSQNESENASNNKENWRGEGKTDANKKRKRKNEKCRKKLTYLDACADWDFLPNGPAIGIPLISNGNLCESVHCDGVKIIVKDTCAFDSLLQVI